MMKLSDLIVYYNMVSSLSLAAMQETVQREAKSVLVDVGSKSVNDTSGLEKALSALYGAAEQVTAELNVIKEDTLDYLEQAEKPMFSHSYEVFEREKDFDHPTFIERRAMPMTDAGKEIVLGCIRNRVSWQWAGLVIQPLTMPFMDEMVACDPLYLTDQTVYLVDPVIEKYHSDYQRRLRRHIFQHDQLARFAALPQGQFGLVVAIDFFNHTPFEVLKEFLIEIHALLKPGGTVGFTFNDCDRFEAVQHVEANCAAYTPNRLVIPLVEMLGYEIVNTTYVNGSSTWVEAKKPGTISSIRGGQCLAKILDERNTKLYN